MGDPEGQNMHGGRTPGTVAKNVSRIQVKEDDYYEDDGQTHDGGEQDLAVEVIVGFVRKYGWKVIIVILIHTCV